MDKNETFKPPIITLYAPIILIDIDTPYPERPKNYPFVHWIKIDVKEDKNSSGIEIVSYMPMNPPPDSKPHRYNIKLL